MKTKLDVSKDGRAVVTVDDAKGGVSRWDMAPDQLEPHMRGHGEDKDHPWSGMSAGDKSAALDAIREHQKKHK